MFVRIFTATRKLGSTAPQPSKTFFLQDSGPVRVVSLVTVSLGGRGGGRGWLTDVSVLVIKKGSPTYINYIYICVNRISIYRCITCEMLYVYVAYYPLLLVWDDADLAW